MVTSWASTNLHPMAESPNFVALWRVDISIDPNRDTKSSARISVFRESGTRREFHRSKTSPKQTKCCQLVALTVIIFNKPKKYVLPERNNWKRFEWSKTNYSLAIPFKTKISCNPLFELNLENGTKYCRNVDKKFIYFFIYFKINLKSDLKIQCPNIKQLIIYITILKVIY